MPYEPISFEIFVLSKGVFAFDRLHPNVQRALRVAYDVEVMQNLPAQRTPATPKVTEYERPLRLNASGRIGAIRLAEKVTDFALEAAAEGDGKKLRKYSMTAYTGAAMNVGWGPPVVVDLSGMKVSSQRLPNFLNHEPSAIVGHSESIEVSAQRVYVNGIVSGVGEASQELLALASNGFPWQASIGADVHKSEFIDKGETVKVNGKNFTGPIIVARSTTLQEISFTPIGADNNTSATVAAHYQGGNPVNFSQWLQANGFAEESTLSDQQKKFLKAAFDAEVARPATAAVPVATPAPAIPDPTAEIRARAAAETSRIADVARICAGNPGLETEIDDPANPGKKLSVNLQAHAIRHGWDARETSRELELATLRAARTVAVQVGGHDRDCTRDALQGAMLLRAGARLDNPVYSRPEALYAKLPQWLRAGLNADQRQRAMESAHRYRDMSLMEICCEAVRLDGRTLPSGREERIRAAFSGGALTEIFTTNVNAMVIAAYLESGDTTGVWTATEDVNDFKTNEDIRIVTGPGLAKLPRGGEADHAAYSDAYETYKIARYAKQFVVDEQDVIDDRFSVFSETPKRLGTAAGRLRPDLVYALLLSNPTMVSPPQLILFSSTAGQGNLNTSVALTSTTLKAGITEMRLLQENGVNINADPTHILIPPTLDFTTREFLNSTLIVLAGSTDSARGNTNTLQNLVEPIIEKRIENGVIDPSSGTSYSGSASTWYLISNNVPTFRVAYLRGTGRVPRIRSWVLEQGKYGMGWDINLDIGASACDWRGLQKNTA